MCKQMFVLCCVLCFVTCCGTEGEDAHKSHAPPKNAIAENAVSSEVPLDQQQWMTLAERTDFKSTSNYEQTINFLRRLDERLPQMTLTTFGRSAQGRDLPLVILGDGVRTAKDAHASGKPIILVQNAIHPGEVDGKDACLMILRDILFGQRRWILDVAVLIIVPIYNVDGHERISPKHRPNQDGPLDGMGFRTTTQGLDLNRDHVKLVSPEARALVALFNEWRPHLHVDNHVTDGCDHDWVLTYMMSEKPQLAPPLHDWLWNHVPRVLSSIEKMGHKSGPYVWLEDRNDPSKGFTSSLGPPRLSTPYFALRNRPSILVETHSYKPFKQRVLATRDFLVELIREVGESGRELMVATKAADDAIVDLGKPDAPSSQIVLSYNTPKEPDTISFPIYESSLETSIIFGGPLISYKRGVLDEKEVSWFHGAEPDVVVSRPRGYLVLSGWPVVESTLKAQGIEIYKLTEPLETVVETKRLSNPQFDKESYQGEIRTKVDVKVQNERRLFPIGTLWIPADQPDFETAAHLLEPEAPDSLVSWGMLLSIHELKTYISPMVLEEQVKELILDPEIKRAWTQALKDKDFASDRRARFVWWYNHTDHWDEQVGLLPAMRVMVLPQMAIEPI